MERKNEGLKSLGFFNLGHVFWNLPTAALYEEVIRRREGMISHLGPLVVRTGQYTGRSPQDKYIVDEEESREKVWWGEVNRHLDPGRYEHLRSRVLAYLQGRDLYVQDLYAGADTNYRISLRFITESAWHGLFARNLFIRELDRGKLDSFAPDYTIIHVPYFQAVPEVDGTRSEVFVILHLGRKEVLVGGTSYAGEIKKAVFTVMNYLLPLQGVLSMHCSANFGQDANDVALFFGLSGTGKTTLSIDSSRTLVGDDEHGWGDTGVFNLEGGCYAKAIRLSREHEPEIHDTTRAYGTILENVTIDPVTRRLDLDDDSFTENTRAAFPISHLPNATREGAAGHPRMVFLLTADAFGVMPPIARLTPEQAIYYFLLGYTAKVAGTERGVKEPSATFSPCFGAPFIALSPVVYANMLGEKIRKHDVQAWLVNTGWTGGSYGAGNRIELPHTRAMVRAVLKGEMEGISVEPDAFFGLEVPAQVPGVPVELLRPRKLWLDPGAYDSAASDQAQRFHQAFRKFEQEVTPEVTQSGPPRK